MARSVRVKICGITHLDDALEACACGADALGFIFVKSSPRYIEPERAADIIRLLPPFVATVGVFVNETPRFVDTVRTKTGITAVQLHGDESPLVCRETGGTVIKAFRTGGAFVPAMLDEYDVHAVLLDAYKKGAYGGTGTACDWETAAVLALQFRLVLAGGLNPGNIVKAVRRVKPYAVDVSSGVEIEPGRKDHKKMRQLFKALDKM